MITTITFETSECTYCNNQLLKDLGSVKGIFGAEIDRINGELIIMHTDEVSKNKIIKFLKSINITAISKPEEDEPSEWGCAL